MAFVTTNHIAPNGVRFFLIQYILLLNNKSGCNQYQDMC
jgi:hypothetical protein